MVEWNESEGTIKHTYSSFRKRSLGIVQFDTTMNRFQATGDEFQIKFWDMDNTNILTTIDVEGSLTVRSYFRRSGWFNFLKIERMVMIKKESNRSFQVFLITLNM